MAKHETATNTQLPVRLIDRRGSLRSRGLSRVLRLLLGKPLRHDTDIVVLRQRYEAFDARHVRVDRSVQRIPVDCAGVPAEWISVPETRPGRTLLFLHGGSFAFRFPNTHAAFAARLCRRFAARALIPNYRLAPEHCFPAAPDDCQMTYRWLLANGCDPANLVLVGDSAGGTLTLVTLHRSVRAGEPLPACAVLLSPAVDCTLASPSVVANGAHDPVVQLANLLLLRRHYVPRRSSTPTPTRRRCTPTSRAFRRCSCRPGTLNCCATRRFAPRTKPMPPASTSNWNCGQTWCTAFSSRRSCPRPISRSIRSCVSSQPAPAGQRGRQASARRRAGSRC